MADSRFSALSKDPRYRLPSRKPSRTSVDPRFKRQFTDDDFLKKAEVDRYGRKIKPDRKKGRELARAEKDDNAAISDVVAERDIASSSDEESNEHEDEELDVKAQARDPAREGGFSQSESEEESASDEESDVEVELAEDTAGHEQTESIPMGEVSKRIAAVNLDWDNVRAIDIMAVASSFLPVGGIIESVTIYPSEFGRERLEREELEGPPRDIFASSNRKNEDDMSDDEDDDEEKDKKIERRLQQDQVDEGDEFDTAKLRQYQLERLRYYYAVIACSSKGSAKSLYDSMDGREYLSSANFFDLRFIPDDVLFEDDNPKDECIRLPDGYTPNEFRTEALTHSKVRLTWDDDDTTRKEVQKRAFSRAEIDENDLKAYIGTDSSDAESVSSRKSAAEDRKMKKRDAQRQNMRAALGLAESSAKLGGNKPSGKDDVVGDMQITFTSGLARNDEDEKGVFENEPQDEESTKQRYIRKERDRKQKRKEKMRASRNDEPSEDAEDVMEVPTEDDQGFEDPFFTDPAAAAMAEKKAKKAERTKKLAVQTARDEEAASQRAHLELLMADDKGDVSKHFDMREIEKAEKAARRKGKKKDKKKSKAEESTIRGEDFQVETQDPRFKALFDSHEFAIDPTNPRFKKTEGMNALLAEGRKKRKADDFEEDGGYARAQQKSTQDGRKDGDLSGLIKRLKGGSKST